MEIMLWNTHYAPEVLNPRLQKTSVFQTYPSVYGLPSPPNLFGYQERGWG